MYTHEQTHLALKYCGLQSHTSVYVTRLHTRYVHKCMHAYYLYCSNSFSSLQKVGGGGWGWESSSFGWKGLLNDGWLALCLSGLVQTKSGT